MQSSRKKAVASELALDCDEPEPDRCSPEPDDEQPVRGGKQDVDI